MKLNSILATTLFAAISALSMGAKAAADTDKAAEAKTPATGMEVGKKVKPHSHVEEKTGMPQQMPPAATSEGKSAKLKADKDKSKHFHPRDGKS